jgi:hypothetical protein
MPRGWIDLQPIWPNRYAGFNIGVLLTIAEA